MNRLLSKFIVSVFLLGSCGYSEDSLKDRVAQAMKVSSDEIKLEKLQEGMTSAQNLKIEFEGKQYLVKVFHKNKAEDTRKKEIAAVKIFSDANLGSKLVAVARDNSFYVREYIPGKTLKFADLQKEEILISIAKSMQKLHKIKSDVRSRSLLERAEKHYSRVKKKKIALPTGFDEAFKKFKELYIKLDNIHGFCHNDLNPHNILISEDGKIYFIDFGNSGNANIYEELGYFTLLNGITGEMLLKFLNAYFGREPTDRELETVKTAQKLVCFTSACVYFDFSESKKEKKLSMKVRTRRLDDMLKKETMPTVLSIIKDDLVPSVKSRKKDSIKQYAIASYKEFLDN